MSSRSRPAALTAGRAPADNAVSAMPVVYKIEKAKGLIRTRCYGPVTLADVAEHFRELVRDPDCPRRLNVLLDLRDVTSLPTDSQLRAVAEEIQRIRDTVVFGACAIVAATDALFGTAEVFEVFAAPGFRASKVFRGSADAEAWLAVQEPWKD